MADFANDFKYIRKNIRRTRGVIFGPDQVQSDGSGNILSRPYTRQLPCFADPVEYIIGLNDRHYTRVQDDKIIKKPWGCAGCRVQPVCASLAMERVQSDPSLSAAYDGWEAHCETHTVTGTGKFNTVAWLAFVGAREQITWTDCNDDAINADNRKRAADAKKRRKDKRAASRRRRRVDAATLAIIGNERERKEQTLLALRQLASSPRYITKLSEEGCKLTAAVWQAEEVLALAGVKATTTNVAREIAGDQVSVTFQNRVGEARKRSQRLYEAGYWEDTLDQPVAHERGVAGMVTTDLTP